MKKITLFLFTLISSIGFVSCNSTDKTISDCSSKDCNSSDCNCDSNCRCSSKCPCQH